MYNIPNSKSALNVKNISDTKITAIPNNKKIDSLEGLIVNIEVHL